MIIKVMTWIYLDVEDEEQGQEACVVINRGLEGQMRGFPEGEILDVDVDHFEEVSDAEIDQRGLRE